MTSRPQFPRELLGGHGKPLELLDHDGDDVQKKLYHQVYHDILHQLHDIPPSLTNVAVGTFRSRVLLVPYWKR